MSSTFNYVLVVDDGGEMKTISATEFEAEAQGHLKDNGTRALDLTVFDEIVNAILDRRAIAAGEYDPPDNDTPMTFVWDDDTAQAAVEGDPLGR